MITSASLISIRAYARAGALEKAWEMFRAAGYDRVCDRADVLSVHGRLLKDRAIAASGANRRAFYREAAQAYAHAAKIGGASYPLINAASLSLLAGDRAQARKLARQLLARPDDEMETPYWRCATRAEAHLLLGEIARARTALAEAVACAPQAYEDHAPTLRQFALILDAQHADKTWLDALRPPRTLHFAGSMGLPAGSPDAKIRELIGKERIGFGYGALAAGADILIAQALIDAGAELHLFLPGPVDAFRKASVARYGRHWASCFDAILPKAARVHIIGDDAAWPPAIRLAAEVAMGSAFMQAELLMTEAVQLLILAQAEQSGRESVSAAIGAIWKRGKRRQHVLTAPGRRSVVSGSRQEKDDPAGRLAAVLRIELDDEAARMLPRIAKLLSSPEKPLLPPRWTGEAVVAAFASPEIAARKALSIAGAVANPLRIAGHYAVAREIEDPFGGAPLLAGSAASVTRQIALSTPPSAIHVSENFAAALNAGPTANRPRTEYVGELPPEADCEPMKLFALRR